MKDSVGVGREDETGESGTGVVGGESESTKSNAVSSSIKEYSMAYI